MSDPLTNFDAWLSDDGPAALVLRQQLVAVEGKDGVVFPPTFAASEDKTFRGGYNIDTFADGTNVCVIDTVGSQANRIEPIFAREGYRELVPQVFIGAGERRVNLLEAGHRAGDAIARCAAGLQQELKDAFRALLKGNAEPLAKLAPTSLVFGVWDSRDTQAKHPRLLASTIHAFDVRPLHRSAQYVPSIDYVGENVLEEPADDKTNKSYSERGFRHVPASWTHGGVIAKGGIRRTATLHLAALRHLRAGTDDGRTQALRRYVLGLSMVAFTHAPSGWLRQGCNLVLDPEQPSELRVVHADGRREPRVLGHDEALAFARAAATAFGVGSNRDVRFEADLARKDMADEKPAENKSKKTRGK